METERSQLWNSGTKMKLLTFPILSQTSTQFLLQRANNRYKRTYRVEMTFLSVMQIFSLIPQFAHQSNEDTQPQQLDASKWIGMFRKLFEYPQANTPSFHMKSGFHLKFSVHLQCTQDTVMDRTGLLFWGRGHNKARHIYVIKF